MTNHALSTSKNSNLIAIITKAAMQGKTVNITYNDAKGFVTTRETEPYDIKNNMYWGFCLNKGSIRQFKLDNLLSAEPTNNKYSPRWEVKIKE